ncbi:MAG: hypothetical protein QOH06_3888 [Acidobacteriota bacterium]|jgi:hypothetical protein|nr:hypothetical protein [Acidobacteriota bacterium]
MNSQQAMTFNRVAIHDPEVNNIEGASVLVPEGWTLAGGFYWLPLFSQQADLLIQVTDPSTGASVFTLPSQQYVWTTQPSMLPIGSNWLGSVLLPPARDAFEFVRAIYLSGPLQHLGGARVVHVEDVPKAAAEISRTAGPQRAVRVTRVRHAYEWGGRGWEEEVTINLVYDRPSDLMFWWGYGTAMRAPAGELDRMRPVLSVPLQSLRYTLDWEAALEFARKLFRQYAEGTVDRAGRLGDLWRQHSAEIREIHRATWEERQASQDRKSFALREVLGGIETYKNPYDSHTVEVPAGYDYQWVKRDGTVFQTSNPQDNPGHGSNEEWQLMDRYRPG